MSDDDSRESAIDVEQVLVKTLVKELRRVYDHVDVHQAVTGSSSSNDPDRLLRIVIRWYDNSPVARILFAQDYLVVELGPCRADGWKRVVRIRYQDPTSVERIIELVQQAGL